MKDIFLKRESFILGALIIFTFIIRIHNLSYNSPFVDEALYILEGEKILKGEWQTPLPFDWIGGMPLFYPLLSAFGYKLGGIVAARLINSILGTLSIYFLYKVFVNLKLFTKKKYNEINALIAAFMLSIAPIHLSLSRLAIYDMLAFTILSLALLLLQRAVEGDSRKYYSAASAVLFVAFLAKYAVAIIFPAIIILLLLYAWFFNKRKLENSRYFIINISLAMTIYAFFFFSDLKTFFFNITVGAGGGALRDIAAQFFSETGTWYVFSFIGTIWLLSKRRYIILPIFLFSFIPLTVHLLTKNTLALSQNALYSLIFLLPLTASVFTNLIKKDTFIGYTILITTLSAIILTHSLPELNEFSHFWPNTSKAVSVLQKNMSSNDRILAESAAVLRLSLEKDIQPDSIIGPFNFSYKGFRNLEAYKNAVSDGYFTIIQIENPQSQFSKTVINTLGKKYVPVYTDSPITIYRQR